MPEDLTKWYYGRAMKERAAMNEINIYSLLTMCSAKVNEHGGVESRFGDLHIDLYHLVVFLFSFISSLVSWNQQLYSLYFG